MKTGAAEKELARQLEAVYDAGESAAVATLVFEALTGLDRSRLRLQRETGLTDEQVLRLEAITRRLLQEEPVQYVLNEAWFAGMRLYVDPAVLIPRPETEELVEWIVSDLRARGLDVFDKAPNGADRTEVLKVLDVGTGSGCIALALKQRMPRAEVWGCDVSDEALNVARRNGSTLDIRVDFQGVDFLSDAQQTLLPSVDVLVSNPPYIPLKDRSSMHGNVVQWEPHTALFVPDNDPLLFYAAIARFCNRRLHTGGVVYLEIHEELGAAVTELFRHAGYANVELRKDLQGKDRMVRVSRI
ncbi:peptide chain release factor N(5)-glutamine methyltransferase [Flaviaesturariibacter amylovorans]|uniref:Release factor glutamine methyltransferase n=1 Tax=Flaviaesturariibacter amylovorans TaxID=1084520 RepID=A0ABP8GNU0_9BACT